MLCNEIKRLVTNPQTACPVPAACQNDDETGDIELEPDDEQTSSDQENSRLTPCLKRPSEQLVVGCVFLKGGLFPGVSVMRRG